MEVVILMLLTNSGLHEKSYTEWVEYVTNYGDTFDSLAMDLYDKEVLASEIIAENPHYADVLLFDAGVTLYLPVITDVEKLATKPPWERGELGEITI